MTQVTLEGGPHDGDTLDIEYVGKELRYPSYEGRYVLRGFKRVLTYEWKPTEASSPKR